MAGTLQRANDGVVLRRGETLTTSEPVGESCKTPILEIWCGRRDLNPHEVTLNGF